MNSQTESSGRSSQQLHAALLDYARSPGKYHVALRQPPLLFASVRQILQIAAGREPEVGAATDEERAALSRAACFFTRTALLSPGADHYTLFGLDRNFDGAELKDHYRLLMRLIHPDFAGTVPFSWPADAAVRVNLAYEVLSSAVQRSQYEARLATASSMPPSAKVEHRRTQPTVRSPRTGMSRSRFKQLVTVSSVAGACAVLISLLMGGSEAVHLVQRVRVPAAPALPAAEQVVAAVQESPLPGPVQLQAKAPAEPVLTTPAPRQPSPAAAVSALMSQMFTSPASERPPAARVAVRAPAPPPQPLPLQSTAMQSYTRPDTAAADAPPAPPPAPPSPALVPPEPAPAPAPAMASAPAPATEVPPARTATVALAVPVAAPVPRPGPVAGVSLAEAQPLLSNLLQQLESGRGERVINLLDREARNKPGAQALSRQYDSLVEGVRPVRLSHVEFRAEPADGRLLVTGHIHLQVGEQTIGSMGKKMVLRAEFVSREGTVVMTGLSGVPDN